jgi:hypothetical protein
MCIHECPEWFHSIQLAPGIVTKKSLPLLEHEHELSLLRLPDLRGRAVHHSGSTWLSQKA